MTQGQVARFRFFISLLGLWLLFTACALPSSARPSASAQEITVTIVAVGARAVQVMGEDGRTVTLAFGPESAFLRRGLLVRAGEFLPGETAWLRRHTGKGGAMQVGLLCDVDSAAMLEKYRGRPLTGTLLSASPQVWVVQPADRADLVPLSLLISARMLFTARGERVAATAFEPGASVTVTTRGLPSGLLSLVSASDAADLEGALTRMPPRSGFVSGLVTELQPSALTVRDKSGISHTIAADGATRVKVRRQPAALSDISVGMRVSAWLGHREDASGIPIATTLSATDIPTGKKKPRL